MTEREGRFEHEGTEPHGQAAEFVDTPENQPGTQEPPDAEFAPAPGQGEPQPGD